MDKSIAIGVVSNGMMHVETCASLMQMHAALTVPSTLVMVMGCYLHRNMNELVEKAIATGATHLMVIDTDMVFDKEAVNQLLDYNLDIIGVKYNKRQFPITPIVKEQITELSEVEFVPSGFMLVKLEIFKNIPKPWFSFDEANGIVDADRYFCLKAKQAGYKVWCDPTIKIGHLGKVQF